MITLNSLDINALLASFLWPFTRIMGLLAIAPLFGNAGIPAQLKVALGILLSAIVAPTLAALPPMDPMSVAGVLVLAQQFIIGVAMGFAVRIVFTAVELAGELCGMDRGDAMQRAHEVLNYVGLDEARYRPVESYSTGMKQRLKLAAAVVHDPKLLILDEPTNGMDPAGRQEMIELARDLAHGKGMSLIFSSHLLPDVEAVCDHVLVLGRGALLAHR